VVNAQSRAPRIADAVQAKHAIVFELGARVPSRVTTASNAGGTFAFEVIPIEHGLD
jgi:hypothetical protein